MLSLTKLVSGFSVNTREETQHFHPDEPSVFTSVQLQSLLTHSHRTLQHTATYATLCVCVCVSIFWSLLILLV